ncbi:MAG: PAS domain S-box protein [Proteobacteria bacterium]|nr:PAS domain S-box protein [Pseudomonadota bacterium]
MKKDSGVFSVFISPRSFPLTVAIIFLLVLGAASVIAYQHYRSTLHHTINENKSTANILSTLIYEHQKVAIGILESYASRPAFVDAIQKKAFNQAITRLKSLSEHHTEIDTPFLTDQYGTLWANYPVSREGFGKNLAHRDWYKGVSRNWRPYIFSAYRLVVLGKGLAIAVSVPVFDKKGKVIGILSSAQRTAFLTTLVKANTLDPKKSITLLDQEGNIIYSNTVEYEKEITKYPQFSLIQKTIRDGKNTFEIPDRLKGAKENILAFSPIRGIGWTIIVGEEKGAILKSEKGYFIGIFVISFLLFVCMTITPLLLQKELRYRKTKELLANERQLRETEVRYKELFENVNVGVAVYEAIKDGNNFIFKDFNKGAETIENIKREDIIGKKVTEAFPGVTEFGLLDVFMRVWKTGNPEHYPISFYKDNRIIGWRDNYVYKPPSGEIVAVYEDVTAQKQAEETIRLSEGRFKNLYQESPIPTFTWQKKENDFILVDFNRAAIQITNGKVRDFLGNSAVEMYRNRPQVLGNMNLCFQEQSIVRQELISRDFAPGRFLSVSYGFIPPDLIIVHIEDLTERKQAEEFLRQAEQKYRSIFENSVEGIFQTSPEGQYISVNPALARMIGYDSPEELMKGVTDLSKQGYVNPEDRVRYKKILEEQGIIQGFETQHYKKDGSIIWASINARVVKDEAGKVRYYEGTIENISPRKLAEEELKQTLEKLRKSLSGTIQAMSLTVETRDPYTAGHQRKVSSLARTIAQEMGLSNDTVDTIRMAGIIHDIGKISIPAEILSKPGKLSDMEFSLIKIHAQTGYDILKDVELPYPIAEIVLQHHERLDGSGYPQQLKGDHILLEAKIISVADVVEAIASHRPYRPGFGIDVALEEIEKNAGVLYDAGVVEACLKLFREKQFSFE